MKQYGELFSEIYQLRIKVLLDISIHDHALKQKVMSDIYEKGKKICDQDPASLKEDTLVNITRETISELISVPTGMNPSLIIKNMSEEEKKTAVLYFQENRNEDEIAAELGISREKAAVLISAAAAEIENRLRFIDCGEGITAAGFMIGMMKAYPVPVIPSPAVLDTPGISSAAPKAFEAGGTPGTSAAVSSVPEAAVSSGGSAVQSSAVYTAANAGPEIIGAAKTAIAAGSVKTAAAAGGLSTAKIAITAAVAAAIGGGGYGIYRIVSGSDKAPDAEVSAEPEIEEALETPVPEEIAAETEEPAPEPTPEPTPEPAPDLEDVDIASLPESLTPFLVQYYSFYGVYNDYDCENPIDESLLQNTSMGWDLHSDNILGAIINEGMGSVIEYNKYPGANGQDHYDEEDPFGWSEYGYITFDGPSIDWIAMNIFNISEENIAALAVIGEEDQEFRRVENDDGSYYYYVPVKGMGLYELDIEITKAQTDGTRYWITFDGFDRYGELSWEEYLNTCLAEVELKEFDGKEYWVLYRSTRSRHA